MYINVLFEGIKIKTGLTSPREVQVFSILQRDKILFIFEPEIFEVSEVVWILNSSKNFESINQMSCLVINLAVP